MFWVILIIVLVVIFLIWRKTKALKLDCITLVVGGVKCGKTTLQVYLAIKAHKRAVLKWKINCFFIKCINAFRKKKKDLPEEPLLYSNIPLLYPHVRLTKELLLREERFNYKSIVLESETSLIADSMSYKNDEANDSLTLYYKLVGHEMHGGSVFVETQNPSDNHYALRRCINRYLYIHHMIKWIPFILVYKVREFAYLDGVDGVTNSFDSDVEDSMKTLIISKRIWKKFDAYTYSALTDGLPSNTNIINPNEVNTLKCKDILSLKEIMKERKKKNGA